MAWPTAKLFSCDSPYAVQWVLRALPCCRELLLLGTLGQSTSSASMSQPMPRFQMLLDSRQQRIAQHWSKTPLWVRLHPNEDLASR